MEILQNINCRVNFILLKIFLQKKKKYAEHDTVSRLNRERDISLLIFESDLI